MEIFLFVTAVTVNQSIMIAFLNKVGANKMCKNLDMLNRYYFVPFLESLDCCLYVII